MFINGGNDAIICKMLTKTMADVALSLNLQFRGFGQLIRSTILDQQEETCGTSKFVWFDRPKDPLKGFLDRFNKETDRPQAHSSIV